MTGLRALAIDPISFLILPRFISIVFTLFMMTLYADFVALVGAAFVGDGLVGVSARSFYNGVTFHRREEGFVIQGGDPKGNGTGGPGYTIPAEFNKQKHVRGAVAMARTQDPNSAGSQFYICLAPANFLDGQYTVFGIVTKGMDVVDKVKVGDKMKTVKIVEAAQ